MIKKLKEKRIAVSYISTYVFCIKENLKKYNIAKKRKASTQEYIDNIEMCVNECSKYVNILMKW